MADVGEIVYQVQMDVGQLLTSQRQLEQRLNRMDDSFNRTSRAVNDTEQSMLSLSKVAGVVASALSAGAIINAVDEWGQMAARIKMALNSVEGDVERYAEIQQRFLEVSNRNGKAIETTQELYAGSATSMKELGYNTTQTVDYIESLSSAFTANATGAQQTESAMNALNRAMVIGTLKGNDWHSVLNATPSVVADIAKELSRLRGGVKVTENDVKKMAMQGGISMKLFADAMINAREENNALADSMDNTIADGFTKLTNSAKAYYGEMNQTLGITRSVSAGFAVLTDNFDKVSAATNIAIIVMGAKMTGALASTIKAKIGDISASIGQANATLQSARANEYAANTVVRKTQADLAAARSAVALAQAEYNVAKGTLAESTALDNLIAKRTMASKAAIAHTQATIAQTAAINTTSTAARSASLSLGVLKGAMSLIGGPVGAAMLAGAAIYYFYQKSEQAKQEARDFADSIDHLTAKLKELSYQEIARDAQDAKDKQELLRLEMKEQENQLSSLRAQLELQKTALNGMPDLIDKNTTRILREVTRIEGDLAENRKKSEAITRYLVDAQEEYNRKTKEAIDLSVKNALVIFAEKTGFGDLANKIRDATNAKREFNATGADYGGEEGEKLKKQMERRLELSKREGVERAKLQALYAAQDAGIFDKKAIDELQEMAAQEYKNGQVKKESTKATNAAYEALKRQREEIELLNKGYKDGSLEMAKYDAVKALGDKASPEQIKLAEKLAEDKYNIERNLADKKAALELDLVAKAKESHDKQLADLKRITKDDVSLTEQAARRKAEIEAEYQQKIAEIKAKNAVSPQDNLKAQVDPVQQLKNEHERKLALIREFETEKGAITQQGLALMNAANTQYEQDRMNAQWDIWRNQSQANQFLADGLDALGQRSANVITGLLTGTQSLNDAFRNVALTIVDQAVGALVQMGMQQVKNMITENAMRKASNAQAVAEATATGGAITAAMAPAAATTSIATMGSAATWGMAAMAAAIPAMIALAGARKNGGQVGAGKMYQVGEGGKPEIFKASNGNQYMIPGDNGRVISNRQMGKGGNGVSMGDMHFTFQVQAPNGITQKEAQQIQQMVRGTVYDVLGTEMRSGGALEKARSW